MSNQIRDAIAQIRKRLDEIEQQLAYIPNDGGDDILTRHRKKVELSDWMDMNGFPKTDSVRRGLRVVDELIKEGLSLQQIMIHRQITKKQAVKGYIAEFFAQRSKAKST